MYTTNSHISAAAAAAAAAVVAFASYCLVDKNRSIMG
jgi:hypothetical protein